MTSLLWKFFGGIALKPSVAPTTPEDGDIYYDSTVKKLLLYQTSSFSALSTGNSYVGTLPEVGGASPFVMTISNNKSQVINTGGIIRLPTTGVKSGDEFTIVNRSTSELDIQASTAGSSVDKIYTGKIVCVALQNTPTLNSHWYVLEVFEKFDFSSVFNFSASPIGTFTLKVVRINKLATVHFPPINATGQSGNITAVTALYSKIHPVLDTRMETFMFELSSPLSGTIHIDTSGNITIAKSYNTPFAGTGGTSGLPAGVAVTYVLA